MTNAHLKMGISMSDLSFWFDGSSQPILQDINYEIGAGEKIGLVGPSGSGKTTLLKLVAGLLEAKKGTVSLCGVPISRKNLKESRSLSQKIGMSFQKGGLLDAFNVWDNIDFALKEITSLNKEEREQEIELQLRQVGLLEARSKRIKDLSGGMLKRLSLARVFALNPTILLLDDPTAGLDPITTGEIVDLIQSHTYKNGKILMFSSSDLSVANRLASKVSFVWHGSISPGMSPAAFNSSSDPAIKQFVQGGLAGPLTEVFDA